MKLDLIYVPQAEKLPGRHIHTYIHYVPTQITKTPKPAEHIKINERRKKLTKVSASYTTFVSAVGVLLFPKIRPCLDHQKWPLENPWTIWEYLKPVAIAIKSISAVFGCACWCRRLTEFQAHHFRQDTPKNYSILLHLSRIPQIPWPIFIHLWILEIHKIHSFDDVYVSVNFSKPSVKCHMTLL